MACFTNHTYFVFSYPKLQAVLRRWLWRPVWIPYYQLQTTPAFVMCSHPTGNRRHIWVRRSDIAEDSFVAATKLPPPPTPLKIPLVNFLLRLVMSRWGAFASWMCRAFAPRLNSAFYFIHLAKTSTAILVQQSPPENLELLLYPHKSPSRCHVSLCVSLTVTG